MIFRAVRDLLQGTSASNLRAVSPQSRSTLLETFVAPLEKLPGRHPGFPQKGPERTNGRRGRVRKARVKTRAKTGPGILAQLGARIGPIAVGGTRNPKVCSSCCSAPSCDEFRCSFVRVVSSFSLFVCFCRLTRCRSSARGVSANLHSHALPPGLITTSYWVVTQGYDEAEA